MDRNQIRSNQKSIMGYDYNEEVCQSLRMSMSCPFLCEMDNSIERGKIGY